MLPMLPTPWRRLWGTPVCLWVGCGAHLQVPQYSRRFCSSEVCSSNLIRWPHFGEAIMPLKVSLWPIMNAL